GGPGPGAHCRGGLAGGPDGVRRVVRPRCGAAVRDEPERAPYRPQARRSQRCGPMMSGIGGGGNFARTSNPGDIDEDGTKLYDHRVMVRLLGYLAPYKKEVAFSIAGVIVYTLATIIIPVLIAVGIDNYITRRDMAGLNRLALVFAAVLAIYYV